MAALNSILSAGTSETNPSYLNLKIRLTNGIAVFFVGMGLFYVFLSMYVMPDIVPFCIISVILYAMVPVLNRSGYNLLSRYIAAINPAAIVFLVHISQIKVGEPLMAGNLLVAVAMTVLPWVLFDARENGHLFFTFIVSCLLIFLVEPLNGLEEPAADMDRTMMMSPAMQNISTVTTCVILATCLYLLQRENKETEIKNERLVKDSEEKNNEMLANEAKLNNYILEIEKTREEDKKREWANNGLAKFADILRGNSTDDIQKTFDNILSNLVKYLSANQGVLFVVEEVNNENVLELKSAYAYDRKKFVDKKVHIGEGLLGQCYLEKDIIYLTEVPSEYVHITSGLGLATPTAVLLVPLMLNEEVFGVIELAAFKPFEKFEVEFLQKVGESIASSISNLKVNERTKELLAQSLQQSEEMRSQEEEMRQNFEELSATQEEMHRILHEAQQKELYLNELINASNDSIFTLDNNYQLLSWNKTLEVMLQASGVKVFKGFPLLSLFPNEKQKEEQVALYNRALQGESFEITTEYTTDGITSHYRNGLSPLKNDKGEIFGIVSFSKDVTEMVVAQQKAEKLTLEANQQIEELRAQEEEIRQNMEELSSTQEEMHQVLQDVQEKEAYMRNFINASSDTILAVDANLRISMFNKAFEDFAEKTFKRKVEKGVNVEVFLNKENLDKQLEVYRNVLKNGETFELIKKYGDQTLDIKYSPIRDDNNKIIGVSLFTKDVSELEKLRTLVHAN